MENLPTAPINDVKDLVLRNGQTWRDLWNRWANKITPKTAMIELAKLAAALPYRDSAEIDSALKLETYAETLVKEGVPYFALGNAVGAFVRGTVPSMHKFFPSLPELLEECERQFQALMKVAPDFATSKKWEPKPVPENVQRRIDTMRSNWMQRLVKEPNLTYHESMMRDVKQTLGKVPDWAHDRQRTEAAKRYEDYVRQAEATRRKREEAATAAAERRAERGIEP